MQNGKVVTTFIHHNVNCTVLHWEWNTNKKNHQQQKTHSKTNKEKNPPNVKKKLVWNKIAPFEIIEDILKYVYFRLKTNEIN